jgi:putative ABC transport system substrate-binding protein
MRRREFIAGLGSAAAWPVVARAQQPERVRRIGVLLGATEAQDPESQSRVKALREGLEALGWSEGRNIRIDYRFAGGDAEHIKAHAAELVNASPDLIVVNSSPALAALKQATHTIPVVFAIVTDPVGQGFIANLARPGGNITGFTLIDFEIVGKWLEILKEMSPAVRQAALIFNPDTVPYYPTYLRELAIVSPISAAELAAAPVHDEAEVEADKGARARAGSRAHNCCRSVYCCSPCADYLVGGATPAASGLPISAVLHRRRPDVLWT